MTVKEFINKKPLTDFVTNVYINTYDDKKLWEITDYEISKDWIINIWGQDRELNWLDLTLVTDNSIILCIEDYQTIRLDKKCLKLILNK